jgi:hypothetical protein
VIHSFPDRRDNRPGCAAVGVAGAMFCWLRDGTPPWEVTQLEEQGEEKPGQSQGQPEFKMKSGHNILTAEVEWVRMQGIAQAVKPP